MGKKMKRACAMLLASMLLTQPVLSYAQRYTISERAIIEALPETIMTRGNSEVIQCEVTGDTYVWDRTTGEADKNYGTEKGVEIKTTTGGPGYTREGYYIIDLSGITEPYIASAKLHINYESIRGTVAHKAEEVLSVYETTAFNEMTVTWNNKPAPVKKITEVTVDRSKENTYFQIDLTAYINEALAKGEVLGEKYFIIKIDMKDANNNSGIRLTSREDTKKPYLEVQTGLPAFEVGIEGIADKAEVTNEALSITVKPESMVEGVNFTTTVTLNGEEVVGVEGAYAMQLVSGLNHIQVVVVDQEGNRVEKNYRVTLVDDSLNQVFAQLRKNWSDKETMNNLYGLGNADYTAAMVKLDEEVAELWDEMTKHNPDMGVDTRTELWAKYNTKTSSAHLSYCFENIKKMATAYSAQGSSYYKDPALLQDTLLALDWMYANRYHEKVGRIYDNWYHWNISGPQNLGSALIMLYDELSEKQIADQLRALNHFNKDPFVSIGIYNNVIKMEAANLLDKLLVKGLTGLIANSSNDLIFTGEAVCTVLPYVTSGNGFYEDGSYVDHRTIPYAGGYGGSLMKGLSQILFILNGSPWQVTDPLINNVYDWIPNAFEPFYYKGAIMDAVSGRGIARYGGSDHSRGKGLLIQMLNLAQTAPMDKRIPILSFIKEQILSDTVCENYFEKLNTNDTILVKKLLEDTKIPARGDLSLNKVFGAMDRTVHHRPGFSLAISMFSTRISAYEVGNGENLKAWHTADGMTYLYNDDHTQFNDDFWPTVDPMRLPGITTDYSTRMNKDWYDYHSSKDWVGGSSIHGLYGATGMEFEMEPGKSTLTGKKSWFMFDDEVVALGTGINATDNVAVETIVENRKIKGNNTILVDGREVQNGFGESQVASANWAHLSGNTAAGTDMIGYYFPESAPLSVTREARTGSWKDIHSTSANSEAITRNYASLAINHGISPTNADYSYVLLPNKTPAEVAKYSRTADIEILANTKDVQAVRENRLGIMGINFWNPTSVAGVSAKNPCSVMVEEVGKTVSLGISDPTHKAKEVVVVLDKNAYEVKRKDDTVSVVETEAGIEITVNTAKSLGKTHTVELVSTAITTAPVVTIDAPTQVLAGEAFDVYLGLSQINQLVYAQDIFLNYNEGLFELDDVQGLGGTEVVVEQQGAGVWRILAATPGGITEGLDAIALSFKAKEINATAVGNIAITKGELGFVNEGITNKVAVEPSTTEVSVVVPVFEGESEDVNQDGKIDIADLALVAYYYTAKVGDDNWKQAKRADVNGDQRVDLLDLAFVANKMLNKNQ